jgi:hypothetical protein
MRAEKRVPVTVLNGASMGGNGSTATVDFTETLRTWAPETKIRGILLRLTGTWTSGGAGDAYDEIALMRLFNRIELKPPGGWTYYDLPSQAGVNLYKLMWAMRGRRPPWLVNGSADTDGGAGATTTVTMTNTLAFRAHCYVPFSTFGSLEQDDVNVYLRDLIGAQLLVGTPNSTPAGGIFDTGADNQGVATADLALTAFLDLAGTDGYTKSVPFMISQHDPSGQDTTLSWANGKVVHWILHVPTQADNTTARTTLSDANVDEINVSFGGQYVTERMDARQQCQLWNEVFPTSRDEDLAHHESGSLWVPSLFPGRRNWRFTHSQRAGIDTKYRYTGTATTQRLIALTTGLNNAEELGRALARNEAPVPEDFLTNAGSYLHVKTASKSRKPLQAHPDAAQRLPIGIGWAA